MAKKIFDILPPREEGRKEEPPIEEISEKRSPGFKFKFDFNFKGLAGFKGLVLFSLFVLIFLFVFSFRFSRATVRIWPEMETRSFETEVTVDKKAGHLDIENKVLPGRIFEVEKTISGKFPASGTVFKKAEGVIRLYNNFTTKNETWLAGTRFVSSGGKLFRSKNKIFVPGARMVNGRMVPSFVDVPVVADKGGSDYNIGPSKFVIIAFRGTPRYTKYYGESLSSIKGGGEVSQVRKEDLEKAEDSLTKKAEEEIRKEIESKIPDDFDFLKNNLKISILGKNSLARPGTEGKTFDFQIKAKGTTLAFSKKDINAIVKKYIQGEIPKDKKLFEKSLKIKYSLNEPFSPISGRMALSLYLSAEIYPEINLASLKKVLAGRPLSETKVLLNSQSDISRTEVQISPFWIKKLPNDIRRIEIYYGLD